MEQRDHRAALLTQPARVFSFWRIHLLSVLSDSYVRIVLSLCFNDCFVLKLCGACCCLHPAVFSLHLSSTFPLVFPMKVWCML